MNLRAITAVTLFSLMPGAAALAAPANKISRVLLTFYWVIDETSSRYRGDRNATLRDGRGRLIAHTTMRFKKDLVMEGTGWLTDGRTVMFYKRVHGESRFRITKSKFGVGVTGRSLVPYRTVAVDPKVIRLGSKICIPQLKDARLPDGTLHDGLFVANDSGHFRGPHVDLFTGAGAKASAPFARKGYGSRSRVTVYVLRDSADDCDDVD